MKPEAQLPIKRFDASHLVPHYHIDLELERKIRDAATPVVTPMVGKWKLMDVRKDGDDLTIRVMINEADRSMQSLTKKPDGTLVFRKQEKKLDSTPNFSGCASWEVELEQIAQEEVFKIATRLMGARKIREETLNPNAPTIYQTTRRIAAIIVEKALLPMTPTETMEWPIKPPEEHINQANLRRIANETARKYLVNPTARRLANRIFNPGDITNHTKISHYNTVVLNKKIFEELIDTSPRSSGTTQTP